MNISMNPILLHRFCWNFIWDFHESLSGNSDCHPYWYINTVNLHKAINWIFPASHKPFHSVEIQYKRLLLIYSSLLLFLSMLNKLQRLPLVILYTSLQSIYMLSNLPVLNTSASNHSWCFLQILCISGAQNRRYTSIHIYFFSFTSMNSINTNLQMWTIKKSYT
jgi:hypothetical protein